MYKNLCIGLLVSTLAACSLTVEEPPVASQSKNLSDYDGDGVIAARDRCEFTPDPAIVDNDGCPDVVSGQSQNDVHVLFANDSTVIPNQYYAQLDKTKQFLDKYPSASIELHGYASPVGSKEHNEYLAKTRAENVRQALIDAGVSPSRIRTLGFGDNDPVQAQSEEETMRLSRRVVAQVVGSSANVVEEWTIFTTRDK